MVWWKFRSCPRCDGDMFIDRDQYGWYEHCIQCGYIGDLVKRAALGQQLAYSTRERRRRVGTSKQGKVASDG